MKRHPRKPSRRKILTSFLDGDNTDLSREIVIAIVARSFGLRPATVERLVADASRKGWVI